MLNVHALTREFVAALSVEFDRGDRGWRLHDLATKLLLKFTGQRAEISPIKRRECFIPRGNGTGYIV